MLQKNGLDDFNPSRVFSGTGVSRTSQSGNTYRERRREESTQEKQGVDNYEGDKGGGAGYCYAMLTQKTLCYFGVILFTFFSKQTFARLKVSTQKV